MYAKIFKEALKRTANLGFLQNEVRVDESRRVIDECFLDTGLEEVLRETFPTLSLENLNGQCIPAHFNVLKAIEKKLKCKAYFTIGSVSLSGNFLFKLTDESINETLSFGVHSEFEFHCWLTLETMEIIDLTLITSHAMYHGIEEKIGVINAMHPDELPKLKYIPVLVGEEYLRKIRVDPNVGIAINWHDIYEEPR